MNDSKNRSTLIIVAVVVVVAGWFFSKAFRKKPASPTSVEEVADENSNTATTPTQEQLGQPIKPTVTPSSPSPTTGMSSANLPTVKVESAESEGDRKVFAAIVEDMRECLEMGRAGGSDTAPVSIDNLNNQMQSEFGAATQQGDRWTTYKLKTPAGEDRLLRVDYFEDEMGMPQREIHYFSQRSEIDVVPIELPQDKTMNPPDSFIQDTLKDGNLNYQEKARYVTYPTGERVDFVEKNGALAEIEVTRGEHFFRCDNVKSRQSCHCVKEE